MEITMDRKRCLTLSVGLLLGLAVLSCTDDPTLFIYGTTEVDSLCGYSEQPGPVTGVLDLNFATEYVADLRFRQSNSSDGETLVITGALISIDGPSGLSVTLPHRQEVPVYASLDSNENVVLPFVLIHDNVGQQLAAAIDRQGTVVPMMIRLEILGETLSGDPIVSNLFTYPIEVCRGCLLEFPAEADDPDLPGRDCSFSTGELPADPCRFGQDDLIDCRSCLAKGYWNECQPG